MFLHYNGKIVNSNFITKIDFKKFADDGIIIIKFQDRKDDIVEGPEAFNVLMKLAPEALEGERVKYHRHAWAIHNLIGHPLMQIFSWLHLTELGIKIHDATVPNPITK